MKEVKIVSKIKHDNIVALLGVCEKPVCLIMEFCECDFEPLNADKKVSSLGQFFSCMNKDIFNSSPGIGNAIASGLIRAVSYLNSKDIYLGI